MPLWRSHANSESSCLRPAIMRTPQRAVAPSQDERSLPVGRRALVERIRRDEFGVGLPLEGEAAELSARLAARTGRALQRLAAELYSTDSHFVMELVQVGAAGAIEVWVGVVGGWGHGGGGRGDGAGDGSGVMCSGATLNFKSTTANPPGFLRERCRWGQAAR